MSYFIAHTITFNKDYTKFKAKGGDNNVVPRCNSWTNWIDIEHLYDNINGNMLQLNNSKEKNYFINYIVNKYRFFGKDGVSYYALHNGYTHGNDKELLQAKKNFDKLFLKDLITGLKNISTKKTHVVQIRDKYIRIKKRNNAYACQDIEDAQLFTEYRAKNIAERYNGIAVKNNHKLI